MIQEKFIIIVAQKRIDILLLKCYSDYRYITNVRYLIEIVRRAEAADAVL